MLASTSDDCSLVVLNSELREMWVFAPHTKKPGLLPVQLYKIKNTNHVFFFCRLRDRQHQDFVKGVSWLHSGSNTLTTVGWDHLVLHHTVDIAAEAPNSSS